MDKDKDKIVAAPLARQQEIAANPGSTVEELTPDWQSLGWMDDDMRQHLTTVLPQTELDRLDRNARAMALALRKALVGRVDQDTISP